MMDSEVIWLPLDGRAQDAGQHQNADSLSKKTEFYERLEQKQANQAEIKDGFSFLDKEIYEAPPLTRWLDKSGHPIPGHPELPVEKAAVIKILTKKDPVRSNLVQQELSRMNINSLSLLDKTVQVTPQVVRMLGELLERQVTRYDPDWAAAVASLSVSEKVKIRPSRLQHKENERDCRTIVQQLVSSIPPRGFNQYFIQSERTGERYAKKTLPLRSRIKKERRLNETWSKSLFGRRLRMGFSERHTTERNEKAPKKVDAFID